MEVIIKHLGTNWNLIQPFERAYKKTLEDLKDGESEFDVCQEYAHFVKWNGDPPLITKLGQNEIELLKRDPLGFRDNKELYRSKCFLWVIVADSLIIAREKISNVKRTHDNKYICHTNLTNGGQAYIGGEVLFGEDGYAYINHFSDRYGGRNTPNELWEATKTVFVEMGYTDLFDLLELI